MRPLLLAGANVRLSNSYRQIIGEKNLQNVHAYICTPFKRGTHMQSHILRLALVWAILGTISVNTGAFAQQVLTMRESFTKRGALTPTGLRQLQWIPESNTFTYAVGNRWVSVRADNPTKTDTIDQFEPINRALQQKGKEPLTGLPPTTWLDRHHVWFHTNTDVYSFSVPGGLVLENSHPDQADNIDYHDKTYRAAYTVGDSLRVSIKGKEQLVAASERSGIVYGKSVHRDEFGIYKGTFWSESGRYLAFYRMDESMVTEYPVYVLDSMPAQVRMVRYPYAGAKSHHVTIGVYDVQTASTIYLNTGGDPEDYLTNVAWTPDDRYIVVAVVNRAQNHLWLRLFDARSGALVRTLLEETATTWVEPEKPVQFVPEKPDQFIFQSERDGYNHLYLYDLSGKLIRQLTQGPTPVINVYGMDDDGKRIFYQMADASGLHRFIGATSLRSGDDEVLTTTEGTHNALFSKTEDDYFLDTYQDTKTPRTVSVQRTKSGSVPTTHFNAKNPLEGITLGTTRFDVVKSAGGFNLNVRTILPPNMDPNRRYPTILYVYNGPHVQMVTNTWMGGADFWMHRLANQGYVIVSVDGRGSAHRGHAFESAIHGQLGTVEMSDQHAAIRFVQQQGWADSSRIGVYGWSYGGFMATSLMTRPESKGIFKCGIAGGPVLDWRMYEIMYTERYMDSPQENLAGYEKNSLFNYINGLNGRLLMIHGSSDPVVTMQHSMRYVRECVKKGKPIDYFVYPEHEHNVIGADRVHLFEKIEAFFKENL
jgi:dipeptidyl-peptidase 4